MTPRLLALLLSSFVIAHSAFAAEQRPNVLLIISDDQGYGDFGFTGNKVVKTPHLDRLAAESAVFRNFVVAPACSPTRSSLLTGRQHLLTGTWGVGPRANMLRDEMRMPRFFQTAGYATGFFGKRDSIHWLEQDAWSLGCDEFAGVWGYVHRDAKFFTREGVVEKKGWTCDSDVDNALSFIKRQDGKPWWCAVAFVLPHLPWEPDERFAAPYREAGCSQTLAACYGSISQMDDATGRLLKGLQELGAAEDTIVVFLSDNGPSYKGLSDEESRSRNPAGLKGTKATAWENGIRVPLMLRWPQRFAAGERTQFASVEDLLPTLADVTGLDVAKLPPHQPWHGISLRPVLENAAAPETERTVFRVAIADDGAVGGKRAFVSDPASLPMTEQHVTLRGPRFKFHQFAGGATALFDLDADPGESRDVKEQFPEIARRYAAELAAEYQRIVSSGRALRMSVVHVGKARPGVNNIDGVMAQRSTGRVKGTAKGPRGFLQAGDSVEYGIDVQMDGNFELTITGECLDRARGWEVRIGNTVVPLKNTSAGQLSFASVSLKPGPASVTVGVRDSADPGENQPILTRVGFRPVSQKSVSKPAGQPTALPVSSPKQTGVPTSPRPNLLIILSDDMGYSDIGCYGGKDIPTPHLDRLAAEGTRCTSAYVTASVCVPSRMGLMSGRYPARLGVYENAHNESSCRLWLQQTTLADVLKQQGYRTANIGKWHLSGNSLQIGADGRGGFLFKPPHERGFDEFVGITGGMNDFWKGTPLARLKDGKYERFESSDYLTDFFGKEACDFIQRVHAKNQEPSIKNKEPFFLYLAFNAVHAPLHGLPEDQKAIEAQDISPDRRKYAAMVRAMDRNVGRVMDKLRELGLAENTLTVFFNDNGGGGNNYKGGTRNTAINRPYRGHKFDLWEGGIRVPFIVHWPGQVPPSETYDGLVSSLDVFPTFAKVAGASAPNDAAKAATPLDGSDLLPFLKGEKTGDPHTHLCWQQEVRIRPNDREPGPAFSNPAYNLAIRSGQWKAIKQDQPFDGSNDTRAWELYDLNRDPAELHDLATEFPDKVKPLSEAFFVWQKQMLPPLVPSGAAKP